MAATDRQSTPAATGRFTVMAPDRLDRAIDEAHRLAAGAPASEVAPPGRGNGGSLRSVRKTSDHPQRVQLASADRNDVLHTFVITIIGGRDLDVFSHTLYSETDCYVEFTFPGSDQGTSVQRSRLVLCDESPHFDSQSTYTITLSAAFPVQQELMHHLATGLEFVLKQRHYYPSVEDRTVAVGCLGVAKLQGLVSAARAGSSQQTYDLQLWPTDDAATLGEGGSTRQSCGLLTVSVRYEKRDIVTAAKATRRVAPFDLETQEPSRTSVRVMRATGLQSACTFALPQHPELALAGEIGPNTYVKVAVATGAGRRGDDQSGRASVWQQTQIMARSFCPEFDQSFSFTGDAQSVVVEVWHRNPLPVEGPEVQQRLEQQETLLAVGRVDLPKGCAGSCTRRGWHTLWAPAPTVGQSADVVETSWRVVGAIELETDGFATGSDAMSDLVVADSSEAQLQVFVEEIYVPASDRRYYVK